MLWNESDEEFGKGNYFTEYKSMEELAADKSLHNLVKNIKRGVISVDFQSG